MPLPLTSDVASLLRARTKPKVGGGSDTGDFSEHTVPTADQVEEEIARAARFVYGAVGAYDALETADPDLYLSVLDLIALRAAMMVERSYHPEASNREGSTFQTLREQFDADSRALVANVRERASSGKLSAGDGFLPASSSLPPAADVNALDVW